MTVFFVPFRDKYQEHPFSRVSPSFVICKNGKLSKSFSGYTKSDKEKQYRISTVEGAALKRLYNNRHKNEKCLTRYQTLVEEITAREILKII